MSSNTEEMVKDLEKSGLTTKDAKARLIDDIERKACNITSAVDGYVFPYFSIKGTPLPFYRVKQFSTGNVKYKQVRNTLNHVYFPPNFLKVLRDSKQRTIIITEGEKKALAATKIGIPAIGFSGVDSWKNRSIILPNDTEFTKFNYGKNVIKAKLPPQVSAEEFQTDTRATGFNDLMDYAIYNNYNFMIIYDSDSLDGIKFKVQIAAAKLAYELRFIGFGMSQIKQLILPVPEGEDTTGIDDFLEHPKGGKERFIKLFNETCNNLRAFPKHPNVKEHVNKQMQAGQLNRKELQSLSLSVITELDSRGYRMHSRGENQMYYFDNQSAKLMQVSLNSDKRSGIQETNFGKLLYKNYGIAPAADARLMQWLGAQFSGEDPISEVDPHRIVARPDPEGDNVRFQISDGKYVEISKDGIELKENGDGGILFEADRTEGLDEEKLLKAIKELQNKPIEMWWDKVLDSARLRDRGDHQKLIALLYYVSPWLYRWRNTQLPVELVIGESGSGKSTLQELRLSIQTGRADLKNAPSDIKDWHAALSNSGGLHVTDNVQLLNKHLRTTLSDEICRLITEPQPHIEMRKLYSNAELVRIKVDNVFVFTAIAQPFQAADLLQRAIIVNFDKGQDTTLSYDSNWKERRMHEFGGREYWLAHHFVVLEKFFKAADKNWNLNYAAKHRLINFEQILVTMARDVFNIEYDWIPNKLKEDVKQTVAANDWALEGLKTFARNHNEQPDRIKPFSTRDIVSWATANVEYQDCTLLINARKLGIYMSHSKHMVHQITGIKEYRKIANRLHYELDFENLKKT